MGAGTLLGAAATASQSSEATAPIHNQLYAWNIIEAMKLENDEDLKRQVERMKVAPQVTIDLGTKTKEAYYHREPLERGAAFVFSAPAGTGKTQVTAALWCLRH